jgi:hypothetical protein
LYSSCLSTLASSSFSRASSVLALSVPPKSFLRLENPVSAFHLMLYPTRPCHARLPCSRRYRTSFVRVGVPTLVAAPSIRFA